MYGNELICLRKRNNIEVFLMECYFKIDLFRYLRLKEQVLKANKVRDKKE